MSLLRSFIACQDWLSTDMPLLTELLASAQTREDTSPVRGEIFVGAGHFDNSQAPSGATSGLPNNFRAVLTGSPSPLPTPSPACRATSFCGAGRSRGGDTP